jgi:hypothetical protein
MAKVRIPRSRPTLEQIVGALTDLNRNSDENYRRLLTAVNNVYGRLMTSVKYPWPLSWFVLWRIEKKIEREMLDRQAALQAAREKEAEGFDHLGRARRSEEGSNVVTMDKTIVGPDGRPA